MTRIEWDQPGERFYEYGLDQGVLYLADGSAVPWNGLVAVEENNTDESEPIYFDGVKIRDVQAIGHWTGTIRALTYPDEFLEYDGYANLGGGLYASDQRPEPFSLSYRTKVANDLTDDYGDRINIVFGLTAMPDSREYLAESNEIEPVDFSWNVSAIPGDVPYQRPSAHFVIDPRAANEFMLVQLQEMLYGTDTTDPHLPPFDEFYDWMSNWWYLTVLDNGDGTITVETSVPEEAFVYLDEEETMVQIVGLPVFNETATSYDVTATSPIPTRYTFPSDPDHVIG